MVEDKRFQELLTLTGTDFKQLQTADEEEATRLENQIATENRSGFGVIAIDNDSSAVCMITKDELQAAQEDAFLLNRNVVAKLFPSRPEFVTRTTEATFRDAKKGECRAIYAERGDLWQLIQGFRRDNVAYSVVPVWFDEKLILSRADELRKEKAGQKKDAADEQRRQEEQVALEARRQEQLAAQSGAQEVELRQKHGPQARARANEILEGLKSIIKGKDTWAAAQFPQIVSWYNDRKLDGWEFVAISHVIDDFGTADWKGRSLEAVITDVSIEMKNRLLGENQTTCFRMGVVFDAEFNMHREPVVADCNDQSASTEWKQARGFTSQWHVSAGPVPGFSIMEVTEQHPKSPASKQGSQGSNNEQGTNSKSDSEWKALIPFFGER